tara:strand:+ start:1566 stop:2513 length:948 start_codon:yes stop_codon:yes gene_type:complete
MWEEDNEAVEGGQVEVAETSEAAEPVEAEAAPEPVETAAAESVDTVSEDAPEVFDWNGELESLRQEQWFNGLDDNMQGSMLRGFETKYQNWARGYQKKFDELSGQRREADKVLEAAREQERKVMKWLHGDVDPMVEKQKEIDNLKVAHKSALETLRDRAETEHEKIKSSFGTELDGAIKARDEAIQQHVALQGQVSEFENAITEQEVDNVEEYMVANASDIYENDEAFDDFILAWKSGAGIDKAIKMVRAIYPQEVPPEPEPEPEPEPVPEGMKLMNMKPDTAAATQGGEPRSFEEMMLARKQEAQREADLIRNA